MTNRSIGLHPEVVVSHQQHPNFIDSVPKQHRMVFDNSQPHPQLSIVPSKQPNTPSRRFPLVANICKPNYLQTKQWCSLIRFLWSSFLFDWIIKENFSIHFIRVRVWNSTSLFSIDCYLTDILPNECYVSVCGSFVRSFFIHVCVCMCIYRRTFE